MAVVITTALSALVFVLLSPLFLVVWLFSLIWKLFKAIITGIDNAWNEKQIEKYYKKGYYSYDRNEN